MTFETWVKITHAEYFPEDYEHKELKESWNAAFSECKRRTLELCKDGTKVWCLDDLIRAIEELEP